MPRYIDADGLGKNLKEMEEDLARDFPLLQRQTLIERERVIEMARQYVLNIQPTANVKEITFAKLKIVDEYLKSGIYRVQRVKCDNCNVEFEYHDKYVFCPFCGDELTD